MKKAHQWANYHRLFKENVCPAIYDGNYKW